MRKHPCGAFAQCGGAAAIAMRLRVGEVTGQLRVVALPAAALADARAARRQRLSQFVVRAHTPPPRKCSGRRRFKISGYWFAVDLVKQKRRKQGRRDRNERTERKPPFPLCTFRIFIRLFVPGTCEWSGQRHCTRPRSRAASGAAASSAAGVPLMGDLHVGQDGAMPAARTQTHPHTRSHTDTGARARSHSHTRIRTHTRAGAHAHARTHTHSHRPSIVHPKRCNAAHAVATQEELRTTPSRHQASSVRSLCA